jgi:hypothetical protein
MPREFCRFALPIPLSPKPTLAKSAQFTEQRLRVLQVERVEAFSEPGTPGRGQLLMQWKIRELSFAATPQYVRSRRLSGHERASNAFGFIRFIADNDRLADNP